MSWGKMDISASGGSKFLRVKDKPVDMHILTPSDEIARKYVHYNGKSYDPCSGKVCAECQDGAKREERFTINVFDRGEQKVKIFEFGTNIAIGIREIAKVLELDGQNIHSVDLRISRISEKPVRYQVVQRKLAGPVPTDLKLYDLGQDVPF